MQVSKNFFIVKEDIGQRIDNYLIKRLKGVPRKKIYSLIRKGLIKVNKITTYFFYRLKKGDNIYIPPLFYSFTKDTFNTDVYLQKKYSVFNNILYEDKYLLIMNKPTGISVHGGSGVPIGIIELLRACNIKTIELVHRLDKDTSGILLLAKKRSSLKALHKQLREQYMQKEYIAIVHGKWNTYYSLINLPIFKKNDKSFVQLNIGKTALSYITVIKYFYKYTLLKIKLLTGRTHQIRVHVAHLGHPIIFDNRYGDKKLDKKFIKDTAIKVTPCILLHAYFLKFYHPNILKIIKIYANCNEFFTHSLMSLYKI